MDAQNGSDLQKPSSKGFRKGSCAAFKVRLEMLAFSPKLHFHLCLTTELDGNTQVGGG